MAFWATGKIAQPIQPIWQHIFALPWSALKKKENFLITYFHEFPLPNFPSNFSQELQRVQFVYRIRTNPRKAWMS